MTLINVLFTNVYRPLLAKRRSPKKQIEHVTNAETVIGTNYWKTEKIMAWKAKRTKNDAEMHQKNKNASNGITTR